MRIVLRTLLAWLALRETGSASLPASLGRAVPDVARTIKAYDLCSRSGASPPVPTLAKMTATQLLSHRQKVLREFEVLHEQLFEEDYDAVQSSIALHRIILQDLSSRDADPSESVLAFWDRVVRAMYPALPWVS